MAEHRHIKTKVVGIHPASVKFLFVQPQIKPLISQQNGVKGNFILLQSENLNMMSLGITKQKAYIHVYMYIPKRNFLPVKNSKFRAVLISIIKIQEINKKNSVQKCTDNTKCD